METAYGRQTKVHAVVVNRVQLAQWDLFMSFLQLGPATLQQSVRSAPAPANTALQPTQLTHPLVAPDPLASGESSLLLLPPTSNSMKGDKA